MKYRRFFVYSLFFFILSYITNIQANQSHYYDIDHLLLINITLGSYSPKPENILDLIKKEDKLNQCIEDYIRKNSRSYVKITQKNLYDLLHNFELVMSKLQNKKPISDNTTFEEKIEALARVQCELYLTMKLLR